MSSLAIYTFVSAIIFLVAGLIWQYKDKLNILIKTFLFVAGVVGIVLFLKS